MRYKNRQHVEQLSSRNLRRLEIVWDAWSKHIEINWKHILKDRGRHISKEQIENLTKKPLKETLHFVEIKNGQLRLRLMTRTESGWFMAVVALKKSGVAYVVSAWDSTHPSSRYLDRKLIDRDYNGKLLAA